MVTPDLIKSFLKIKKRRTKKTHPKLWNVPLIYDLRGIRTPDPVPVKDAILPLNYQIVICEFFPVKVALSQLSYGIEWINNPYW